MCCTEPIAIALCAAKARVVLDALPDYIKVEASGNIIKNVKSVVVPNTGGDARRTSGRDAEAVVVVRVSVLSVNFVDPPADFMAVAGDIGGHANNTPIVVQKQRKIVDNMRHICGMELIHACQAIDLRKRKAGIKLGQGTETVWSESRKKMALCENDRPISSDIQKACEFIKDDKLLTKVRDQQF